MAVNFEEFYPDLATSVIEACRRDQPETLKRLLEEGKPVDSADSAGRQAIHWAAVAGGSKCVRVLVKAGVDIDARSHDGSTPLLYACRALPLPSASTEQEQSKVLEVVHRLLKGRANVNLARDDGATPLHMAARARSLTAVKWLMRCGADPAAKDKDSQTPLLNVTDRLEANSLVRMVRDTEDENMVDIVRYMVSHQHDQLVYCQDDRGFTSLTTAILNRRFQSARVVLDAASDKKRLVNLTLNISGENGSTTSSAVHLLFLQDDEHQEEQEFDSELLQQLIDSGADANHFSHNGHGELPLTCAVEGVQGSVEKNQKVFYLLLSKTTFDWRQKKPCQYGVCNLTQCFMGHPLTAALRLKRFDFARAIIRRQNHVFWSGRMQTNCCRLICRFSPSRGTAVLRTTCQFTKYGHLSVPFMLRSGSTFDKEFVEVMKLMLEEGCPVCPTQEDEVNPLVAFLTTGYSLEEGVESDLIDVFQHYRARLRKCDFDHVLCQARIVRLMQCIDAGLINPSDFLGHYQDGLPSVLLAHVVVPRLYVLWLYVPSKRYQVRDLFLSIMDNATEIVVPRLGTSELASRLCCAWASLADLAGGCFRDTIIRKKPFDKDVQILQVNVPKLLMASHVRVNASCVVDFLQENGFERLI